ncbi:unnamed protein product, partial [Closterium sp. NIES-53]
TSGMGLVLGGWGLVVLTDHVDTSWVYDLATQRSSQGYTFSLGSGSVSWQSTRLSSVLGSSGEAEIYTGAMVALELCWLTNLLTDLGERPRSSPVLYVDNKAMIALCQEHRLEHRTKHISLRYFLSRELQQRGQLHLAYVATWANTADIFTKALQSEPAALAVASPLLPRPVPSPLLSRRPCRRVAPAVASPLLSRPVPLPLLSRPVAPAVASPLLSHPVPSPLLSRRPVALAVPSCRPIVVSPLLSRRVAPCCPFCPTASRRLTCPVPSASRFSSCPVARAPCALPVCRAPCALPVRRAPAAPCPSVTPRVPCLTALVVPDPARHVLSSRVALSITPYAGPLGI